MESHNATEFNPGPLDCSVLTRQNTHLSQDVWNNGGNKILACRRSAGSFWKLVDTNPIHPRVLEVLFHTGFYGVYRAGCITLDHSLITALVERWRPETHTFHLKVGEATITLQDVAILYGLPVEGNPVLGFDASRNPSEWQEICSRLLGFTPNVAHIKNGMLELGAIANHMEGVGQLADDADDLVVHQQARCFIMWIIGGILFPDTTGNKVKLMYLSLLDDIGQISTYSWGSAALAFLYRSLCRASTSEKLQIGGFLSLLQVWVWERLSIFRPDLRKPKHVIVVPDNFPAPPRAYRWSVHLSWKKVVQHVLSVFRDQLDSLVEEQFVWEPYGPTQDFCYIWLAMVPLLCWDVVEMYHPDRVLRQFGMRQLIPEASCIQLLHEKSDRRGRPNYDWGRQHAKHIEVWNNRANRVCHAEMADGPLHISDPYIRWYRRITRLIIGNPMHRAQQPYNFQGPSSEAMVRSLHMIRQSGNILRGREDTEDIGTSVVDLCDSGLTAAGQIERIAVEPDYTPSQDGPSIPNVNRRRRAGGRGRRRNVDETEANDGAGTSTMRGDHLDDIASQQFQQPTYDFPASSTQFSGGSGLHYHSGETFVYHPTPPAEHSPLPNIYGDGFDDDPMQESPSRPDRHVEYNSSPIFPINYESQDTNVGTTEGEPASETVTFSQLSNVTRTYRRRVQPARNRRRPPCGT